MIKADEVVTIAGVDYGAKNAGTSCICYNKGTEMFFALSTRKNDADIFIFDYLVKLKPEITGIDAPLSLPGIYTSGGEDYFYRMADKKTKAMSPMFLGGLTARAIKLADNLELNGVRCIETYPGGLARDLSLDGSKYKKNASHIEELTGTIETQIPFRLNQAPENWHQFDALLCWIICFRFIHGKAKAVGDENEGIIYI